MLQGFRNLPNGISVRPARSGDKAFLRKLYRSTRTDLEALNLEPELFQSIMDLQERAREVGLGTDHPNGIEFILEKLGDPVGRLAVGPDGGGMRIIDLTFIPALRNQGLGTAVVVALQQAATAMKAPLTAVVIVGNADLRNALILLGFRDVEVSPSGALMEWRPGAPATPPGSGPLPMPAPPAE